MYIRLFLLFMKNIHEESADHDSRRIRNGSQKCCLRRCAVATVRNAAEHITVVPGYYKTHDVGEDKSKDDEQILQFFHWRLLLLHQRDFFDDNLPFFDIESKRIAGTVGVWQPVFIEQFCVSRGDPAFPENFVTLIRFVRVRISPVKEKEFRVLGQF